MARVWSVVILCALGVALTAQTKSAWTDPLCADQQKWNDRQPYLCEEREQIIPAQPELDVEPGHNGGIRIRGWSSPNIRIRSRVDASAETDARAKALVSGVRITAVDGRLRSDGRMTMRREHWSTTFYIDVPNNTRLALATHNGGISIEAFRGDVVMRAINGGITLRDVGGDIRGHAQNGGVRIELTGRRWDGTGLDVEGQNGQVRIMLPADYSAELETGTVNGRVEIDFPTLMHPGKQRLFTTTLGSGGPKIRAVTHNGGVVVRRY